MTIYNYEKEADITSDYYPIHTHLCVEYSSHVYFVPFQNTSTIRKLDPSDGSSTLIVTEGGSITKFYLDRSGEKLYYYHEQSVFSYVDLTDDSITDLDDTLNAAEDLFIYDGSLFAVDTSQDDLTFYKYTPGSPGTWGAVGTIAEGATNYYDLGLLGGNDDPIDICWDGTYFYVTDLADAYVYKYNADLDTLVDSFDIGALGGNDTPYCICWDGTYFYVTDGDNYVYKYNAALNTLEDTFDIGALGGNDDPFGICWDGTYFYITDTDGYVYKYNAALDTLVDSFNLGALGGNSAPRGLRWDGTYFYITDAIDGYVYKYNAALDILIDAFDIGSLGGNGNVYSICWDGNFFYTTDFVDGYIYVYSSDLKTELGSMLYTAIIGDNAYIIYKYAIEAAKIYVKDLTDSSNPSLLETLDSTLIIPYLENQRGISVGSDNDTLYFVLKDTDDGLTYLCTYVITTDTFTQVGEYNVSLMLDRNTNTSNDPPFNLEKGFGLTVGTNSLSVYQISRTKGNLWKIADLKNNPDFTGHSIKGITDTYLITSDGSNSQVSTFQDFSNYIIEALIYHPERSYPTAELTYRADKLYLEDGMFLQMIGNVRVNGSTSVGVRFEGYIIAPADEDDESIYIKTVDLLNPVYYDLKNSYAGTLSAGSGDDWLDTIDDDFDYGTKGTYDAGTLSLPETVRNSGKDNQQFIDQLALGEGFTWRFRPTGELDWTNGADDSGLDYDQSTPIYDVEVTKKKIRPNSITVKGGYVNGSQVSSDTDHGQDLPDQQQYGKIPVEVNVAWISTTSLCNSYADAILALVNQEYIEVVFSVRDATNGFVPPGEEITLADSNKGITSAQFKINNVVFDDKTSIATYTVSSVVRWDENDLLFGFEQELSDQVDQLGTSVSGNITDISTNTSDISTNTSDIAALQSQAHEISPSIGVQGGGSDSSAYVTLSAVGHAARVSFIIGDDWDETEDITIIMACLCTSADASVVGQAYVATHPIDNSEGGTWNVENGTATSLDSTVANQLTNWTYTLSSGSWSKGDMVWCQFTLNEAARTVYFYKAAIVKFYKE